MDDLAKDALGHWTSTNIARANEKDGLHQEYGKKLSPVS
jgi:hypothetical protein